MKCDGVLGSERRGNSAEELLRVLLPISDEPASLFIRISRIAQTDTTKHISGMTAKLHSSFICIGPESTKRVIVHGDFLREHQGCRDGRRYGSYGHSAVEATALAKAWQFDDSLETTARSEHVHNVVIGGEGLHRILWASRDATKAGREVPQEVLLATYHDV